MSSTKKNLKIVFNIGRRKSLQSKSKKRISPDGCLRTHLRTQLSRTQRSKMELFVKIVNGIKLLTIFTRSSVLDI